MSSALDTLIARLRFRHLRLLVAVNELGTLSQAATALHLTQPALSKTLKEVEDAFGFDLFRRSSRGLVATPRGEVIVQGAAAMLAGLGHLRDAAQISVVRPTAVLHLGAPPAVAAGGALPAVLALLQEKSAGEKARVLVHVHEGTVPSLFEALMEGQVDALLTSYNQAAFATKRAARLIYERCPEHTYVVIAPRDHPLASKRRVEWHELAGEEWIMPGPALLSRQSLENQFLRSGVEVPVPAVVSNSPSTNVQLVATGIGVAAVPQAMAAADVAMGRVVYLRAAMTPSRVPAALVFKASAAGAPMLQRLRAAVQSLKG